MISLREHKHTLTLNTELHSLHSITIFINLTSKASFDSLQHCDEIE